MHHRFHISNVTPPLPLKILHFLGTTVIPRRHWTQWLCKTLEGKQSVLWAMSKWWVGLNKRTRLRFVFPGQLWSLRCVHVSWSKTVFDSWFHAVVSGFQVLESGLSVELGLRIPIASGIPNSLSYTPDSKAHDSGFDKKNFDSAFHKQNFTGFRIPFYLTWGEYWDHFTFLGNCPPTPPVRQHFAPSKN